MPKQDFRFHTSLRVRWSEGDAQGIAYNGAYLDYIEVAQAEYFRNLGVLLYDEKTRKYFDTATVKATVEFEAPARVDDVLSVYTRISEVGTKSFTMRSEIYRGDSDELLTTSEIVYVDYDAAKGEAREVPDDLRTLIGRFEETGQILPIEQFPNLTPE